MFKGTSASAGIGIGKAVIVEEAELVITRNEVADAEAEIQRFKGALEKTIAATQKMADDLASRVGEKEAEIMQGHMMLLSDPMLTGEIENSVKNDKVNCEFAIENVCNMYEHGIIYADEQEQIFRAEDIIAVTSCPLFNFDCPLSICATTSSISFMVVAFTSVSILSILKRTS